MLGQMRLSGGMYGSNEPTLEADGRILADALAQAIERLPQQHLRGTRRTRSPSQRWMNPFPAPDVVKPNAYCLHDGMVCIREENVLRPLTDMPSETRSRIRHLIPVRDAVRDCLRSQMDGSDEEQVD
jgi:N12 class adenine-specific DNA methylase